MTVNCYMDLKGPSQSVIKCRILASVDIDITSI